LTGYDKVRQAHGHGMDIVYRADETIVRHV